AKIRQSDLQQIVAGNETVIDHAIAFAQGKAQAILSKKFDVAKLYESSKDQREELLVSLLGDMAIYEIVAIALPNVDMEDRRDRANHAVVYLNKLADGEYPVAWPLLPETEQTDSPVTSGGRAQRGNYF
ncbi:MAG: hypothetical protein RSC11_08150, partial [Mucinivorans sp.]